MTELLTQQNESPGHCHWSTGREERETWNKTNTDLYMYYAYNKVNLVSWACACDGARIT